METENASKLVDQIAALTQAATIPTIEAYTNWFMWNSVGWIAVGLMTIYFGARKKDIVIGDFPPVLVRIVCIVIGALFVADNMPDLLQPQGMAIHQLIKDLRGE